MNQIDENKNETESDKIFELLELGTQKLGPSDGSEAVVVVGTTGSGKSAFIQWITGDNSNLIAKETSPGSDEYLIEDKNGKIGSSVLSKTLFPEFETDIATGTTFYDLPGFNDTRSSSHDIAASFFIKSVFDRLKNVKILFTSSYYTVKTGMDRIAFPALLKNIEELIGDVDKFKNSIAFVVTKVDNKKPDRVVVSGIAHFLREIKKVFEDNLSRTDISDEKRRFSKNSINIIKILLSEKNGQYTRIALFRAPDEKGQLSEMVSMVEEKKAVQEVIFKELAFTRIDPNDFCFTVADSSKLGIDSLVINVNDQMNNCLKGIVADIRECLERFVKPMHMKINENNLDSLSMTEAIAFSEQAEHFQEILSAAVDYFSHLNEIDGIVEALTIYLTALRMEVPQSVTEQMSKLLRYLDFFKLFRDNSSQVSSLQWTLYFQSLLTYLIGSKQYIRDKARSLIEVINSEIAIDVDCVAENVKARFQVEQNQMMKIVVSMTGNSTKAETDHLQAKAFYLKLASLVELLKDLVENFKVLSTPGILVETISRILNSVNFSIPNDVLSNISKKSLAFDTLQKASGSSFVFPAAQCLNSFKKVLTFITSENISNMVTNTEKKIETRVDSSLRSLVEAIRINLEKKALQLEIHEMHDELNRWRSHFVVVNEIYKPKNTLKRLIDNLALGLKDLNFNESSVQTHLRILNRQENFLGFVKALKGQTAEIIATSSWEAYIAAIIECFDAELNFTAFLMSLHQVLSQFAVQNDVSRYNVADLSNWGTPSHPQGIHIKKTNFNLFLKKVKDFNVYTENKIINIMPTEKKILTLNNVLKVLVKKPEIIQSPAEPKSKIILKANFIKFSDFLDSNGKYKEYGWENISSLEVHALNTLFIDQDLNARGVRLKLSIVAPKWEVIGNRKINLDGQNVLFPDESCFEFHPLYGSAGAFFGAVGMIVSSENLTISANGGNLSYKSQKTPVQLFEISNGVSGIISVISLEGRSRALKISKGKDFFERMAVIDNEDSILRNFVRLFIENSSERFVRFSSQKFCMQIMMSSELNKVRDTFGLIEDFKLLESCSRDCNSSIAPLYESYLMSIENYAGNPKKNENFDAFKKVLSYLYAATLILISNLKRHEGSDLIIDIGGYLDIISKNVKSLSALHDESRLFTTVETLKNNFKSELDVKIEEAQCLLQETVTPEFSK